MGDVRKLGRVGLKSLFFTLLLTGSSVVLGIALVNIFITAGILAFVK